MPGSVSDRTKSRAPMRDVASWWNQNGGKRSGLNTPPSSQNSESSSSSKKKGTWKSQCIPPGPPKTLFWCRDRLCSSLYPPLPSLAMWLANYKKVCQLAKQGEGRKESKTSERIHSVSFLRLHSLPLGLPGRSDFASASESIHWFVLIKCTSAEEGAAHSQAPFVAASTGSSASITPLRQMYLYMGPSCGGCCCYATACWPV